MLKTTPKTWDLLGENCWYYHHQWWFTTLTLTSTCTRTVFVVMALSFHSTIEGLALALEDEASGVWLNTGVHCNFGWTPVDFAILFEHRCQFQFWLNTGVNFNFGWTQVNFASLVEHRCPLQSVLIAGNLFQAQLLFTNLSFPSPLEWSWSPTRLFICFAFESIHTWPLCVCLIKNHKNDNQGVTFDVLHLHCGLFTRPSTRLDSRYHSYWGTSLYRYR